MARFTRHGFVLFGECRFVVEQVDARHEPGCLGRVERIAQVSITAPFIGSVGQLLVRDRRAVAERDIFTAFGCHALGDIQPVASDRLFEQVQRRGLFPEKESGGGNLMPQRDRPHFEHLVFIQQFVFARAHLVPLYLVGECRIEIVQMVRQYLVERTRGVDFQRRTPSHQSHRRNQPEKSENMVSVQVRDEYGV